MKRFRNLLLLSVVLLVPLIFFQRATAMHSDKGSQLLNAGITNSVDAGQLTFDVSAPVVPHVSRPLRDLPLAADTKPTGGQEINAPRGETVIAGANTQIQDPLAANSVNDGFTPDPLFTFEGIGDLNLYTPPDTVGDVGPDHYVQLVNVKMAVWDKTGNLLYGPVDINTLWDGFGGACENDNDGDPIVLYDDMADRWMISQFALSNLSECVAISTTSDPLGSYYLYGFTMPDFPDYPKFGIWTDGYYVGTNTGFPNQYYAHVFDRNSMLVGAPATRQSFGGYANFLMPADADGTFDPPAGMPEYFYTNYSAGYPNHPPGVDRLAIYEFHVDWANPGNSTFTLATEIPIAAYNYTVCGFFGPDCIPEPAPGVGLDSLSWWPMVRLQYRNLGPYEAMVGNITVDPDGTDKAAIRWFELRKEGGNPWALYQEGTYWPDNSYRWMGSIAMDGSGDIALGYSVSDATVTKPSIRYAVHEYGDPLGTMQAEASIMEGTGVNTGPYGRWGDYSAMSVDPVDQCTFWYTNEYHDVTENSFMWNTRIGVFRVPSCSGGLYPDFTIAATPESQDICVPDNTAFNIDIGQIQGYTDPVTLSASGVPAGYSESFTTNPVIPPGTSTMDLMGSGAAVAGNYDIEITGTAPTSTHSTMVTLNLYDATPGATTLTYPPDNAQGVPLVPTFTWTPSAQGATYRLRVYESGVPTPIYDIVTEDTSHTLGIVLDPVTTYTWTVVPSNVCGDGAEAGPYTFETADIPPILLVDDDDNSPDVRSYYTEALDSLGLVYDIWDTNNSDNEPGSSDLAPYSTVIWFTGDEFGGAAGPGAAGETALGGWLDGGNCLFISSQDYHYDRGQTAFMTNYLGLGSATDDAGNYASVTGQGTVFGGLGPYALAYPFTDYSDIFVAGAGAELGFIGDNSNGAALDKDSGVYRTTFWAFPFEAISLLEGRLEVMQIVVNWCGAGVDTGTLSGTVTDLDSGAGIDGATITAVGSTGSRTTHTNASGDYAMTLAVGDYDVTAEADNYVPETVYGVTIITDTVTTQDFALQGSLFSYSPDYVEQTMEIGDVVSTTITVMNDGPLPIDWQASIGGYGGPGPVSVRPVSINIPRFEGEMPASSEPLSMGRAPNAPALTPEQAASLQQILGASAYGLDVYPGGNLVNFPDADIPGSWNIIGAVPQFHPAADFLNGDFSTLYALDYDTNQFVSIDTATGARTVIGTTSPNGSWSGMTGATDGTLYAVSSVCGSNSTLYTIDPNSGALTTIGNIGAGTCIIDIAINAEGQMYGVDIVSDVLYQIDPNTGVGTLVGPLGASANYAQGMDFEETSGILYWAAYTASGEMRVIDTNTGASALVGAFPGGAEVDGLAFATGGAGGTQWASAVPDSGTIPANSSATFEVVFDARSLISTGDYTAELTFSGTFVNEVPPMPLTMHLGCTNCGFLEGAISDALTGDPVSGEIHVTGTGGYDVTVTGESYSLAVQPGTYDIMVSADGYLPDSANVTVAQGQTVTTDFALYPQEAFLEYSPAYVEETMEIGDVVSNTITVMNTGYDTLNFEVNIGGYGGPGPVSVRPVSINIPRFEGEMPASSEPLSMGRAPNAPALTPEQAASLQQILGASAYGLDVYPGGNLVNFPDADIPGSWNIIGAVPQFHPAADFLNGDFSTLYALDYDTNQFVSIDTATGARTVIGTTSPNGSWSGMTGATDGTLYAVSSVCGSNSTLYTIDPNSGALTTIGNIGAGTCIIDIAINAEGQMYGVDIVSDVLYQIDPNTGVGTLVGPLGASANYAQGMDFEETSGILYWAAYTASGEMRVIDTNTGASALVGAFPGGAEVDGLAFATGGAGGGNWASAVPDSGTVPPGSSVTFEVVFDARSLIQVGDYTAELTFSGNFTNDVPPMPLTMHLSCPTCGILEGSVTDAWTGDPLTADISVTGPGGFNYATTGDSYSIAVPAGMYDFTVSADGYFDGTATVEAIVGQTTVTDFALVPQVATLAYEPATIEVTVPLGGSVMETMMLHNTGTMPFDYSLTDVETGSPAVTPQVVCPPDAFGYTCTDSNEGVVSYDFEDISGTGTPLTLGDDQVSTALPLGFTFNYYGTDYTEIFVSSNGFLTVNAGSSSGCCSGQQLPNPATPNGVIAGWWEDLNPSAGGTIHYQMLGTYPNQYLVVQFTNVPHYPSGLPVTMQFKLFAGSNNIEVHYMDAPSDGGNHSAGIEDQAGAVGLSYYYGGAPLASSLAVCYLYPGQFSCGSGGGDAAWVTENPDAGTINPGETMNVDIVFDASVVTQTGTYEAQLYFDGTFENDVPPATLIMHVVEGGPLFTMDYTYYTQGGGSFSGSLYYNDNGTYMDESGNYGIWKFLPQPPRIAMLYLGGARCGAFSFGRYIGNLHVFGFWTCTDGSGRHGVWTATIVNGFTDGLPSVPMGQETMPITIPE